MADAELPDLNGVLDDAINTAIGDRGEILVKWALVAEVIDAGGERAVYVSSAPEASTVDTLGLFAFGLETQREAFRGPAAG